MLCIFRQNSLITFRKHHVCMHVSWMYKTDTQLQPNEEQYPIVSYQIG